MIVEVGYCKYYRKNGNLHSEGIFKHNHKKYNQAAPIKDGTWKYYDENGQFIQVEKYKCNGNSMGHISKLISRKTKEQIEHGSNVFNQENILNEFYTKLKNIPPKTKTIHKKL